MQLGYDPTGVTDTYDSAGNLVSTIPKVPTAYVPKTGAAGYDFGDAIARALNLYNKQRITNANIDRAQQGQPPLDFPGGGSFNFPSFGMSDETRNTLLVIAAIGIGAFMLLGNRQRTYADIVEDH